MTNESELSRRLNEAMSGTIHEQLRSLVRDARAGIEQFSDAAARQGDLLAEAHLRIGEAQQRLDEALAGIAEDLHRAVGELSAAREADRKALDEIIADLGRRLSNALAELRADIEAKIGAIGEQLEAEADRLGAEIASRTEAISEKLAALDDTGRRMEDRQGSFETRAESIERDIERLRLRLEESVAASTGQWKQVLAQLEDTSGIEERAAQHLATMLNQAFALAIGRTEAPDSVSLTG